VPSALGAEPLELVALVCVAACADQLGVGVVDWPGLSALAAHDRQPLLGQVRAGEVARQVGGGEYQCAVGEAEHASFGSGRANGLRASGEAMQPACRPMPCPD